MAKWTKSVAQLRKDLDLMLWSGSYWSTVPYQPKQPQKKRKKGKRKMEKAIERFYLSDWTNHIKVGQLVRAQYDKSAVAVGIVNCVHPESGDFYLKNAVNELTSIAPLIGVQCPSHHQAFSWHLVSGAAGWFEIIEDKTAVAKPKISYQPGQKVSEFVSKLIETEKDENRLKWLRTFNRCILPEQVKEVIEEALTCVLLRNKFDEWGINDHFEKGVTNSILIYGPPGTGKTMISESIAAVLGMNLLKLTVAALQSQIPGQMERNITTNFENAKRQNAVIMFDECDSLLYNRDAVGAIMAAEINHLLTEIERFEGVCILTTNRLGRLDPALQRRIVAKIELGFPEKLERLSIWKALMPEKMPVEEVDYEWLSRQELTGGEIKNSIMLAARKAIAKNCDKVTMDHLRHGIKTVLDAANDFVLTAPRSVPISSLKTYQPQMEGGKQLCRS